MTADEHCKKLMAPLMGASPDEIAVLGGLTANLHLMLVSCVGPEVLPLIAQILPTDRDALQDPVRIPSLSV